MIIISKLKSFSNNALEKLAKVLGEYTTGSELTDLLSQVGINNDSKRAKWRRIRTAFIHLQNKYNCSNKVLEFIQIVADPVRFIEDHDKFNSLINKLNDILIFSGIKINEKGEAVKTTKSSTLTEAQQRANKLKRKLYNRNIHGDVLKFCKPELLQENYFHAVLEATKSVADKIRNISGLGLDGNKLVNKAFNDKNPIIAINTLETQSERNEQAGLRNLLFGVFKMFRNTTAHEPKIYWEMKEEDAIDLLTTLSFIHRKLDKAVKIPHSN